MISNGETSNPSIGSEQYRVQMLVPLVLISAFAVHVVDAMTDRRSQKAVKSFMFTFEDGLYGVVSYFLAPRFSRNDFTSSDMRLAPLSLIPRWYRVIGNVFTQTLHDGCRVSLRNWIR